MSTHASLTGTNLHQSFHYIQETDPGAVGAGLTWLRKSTKTLSYRDDTNTAWTTILASSNVNALPAGTTWTEFLAAYAALDPGDTIELPNDVILQESHLQLRANIRIRGTGPNSELRLVNNMTSPSAQIYSLWLGWDDTAATRTELSDFKITHDRVSMGASARTSAIRPFNGTYNLHCERLVFEDITASVVTISQEGWVEELPEKKISDGFYLIDCTATEWYESFLDVHEFNEVVRNIHAIGNIGTTSEGHPSGGVSRPYATYISAEESVSGGLVENLIIAKNRFVNAMPSNGNTVGVRFKTTSTPHVRYNRCYVLNNYYENWAQPAGVARMNDDLATTPGDAFIYFYGNTFYGGSGSATMVNLAPGGATAPVLSTVYFGDNDIYKSSSAVAITNAPLGDATVVVDPTNRVTDFLMPWYKIPIVLVDGIYQPLGVRPGYGRFIANGDIVFMPDTDEVPPEAKPLTDDEAIVEIKRRDPKADPRAMMTMKPRAIK